MNLMALLLAGFLGASAGAKEDTTPLMWAAQNGDLEKVKKLVAGGADVNALNSNGVSVLHHTTYFSRVEVARFLIERGARPANAFERERIDKMLAESAAAGKPAPAPKPLDPAPPAPPAENPAPAPAPLGAFGPSPAPSFKAPARRDDLAVIVGIESYSEIAAKAPYAERDADAFKAHVLALGVPERNIVLLRGAKAGKASIEKNVETWLARLAKPTSRVYFFFSGHGAPELRTGKAYLVPWDGDPNFLENTAYPLERLYKRLAALPAERVLVAIDSCFSGAGGRSVLASGARPLVTKVRMDAPAKLAVLAASAGNEISGSLDDKGHGAFTYFLLEGLAAGNTTPKALVDYLTPRVQDEARRLNRDQTPQLQGDGLWSLR